MSSFIEDYPTCLAASSMTSICLSKEPFLPGRFISSLIALFGALFGCNFDHLLDFCS